MKYIKNFEQLSKDDTFLAGGKGSSLGEMTRNNIPVPPGFVVICNSFKKFIKETSLDIEIAAMWDRINVKDADMLERESEILKEIILDKDVPKDIENEILQAFQKLKSKYVAVRSSATAEDSKSAAWAGPT